jgi:tripartite-type tricarboxylate transporter receptor subunit TctC
MNRPQTAAAPQHTKRRTLLQAGVAAAAASALPRVAHAQATDFPNKPVTLYVTFPAGGPTDIAGRALAEATTKYLGQQVVVENRPGASGLLGAVAMTNVKPDGYTLTMLPATTFRTPQIEKMAIDPLKDLTYVMGVSGYLFAILVKADAPWKTLKELTDFAKANPGKVSFGSHGIGSTMHLAMEDISSQAGIKLNHIPYKGSVDMLTAALGGHLDVAADTTGAIPHVQAGKLRPLAVFTEKRAAVWPDAPTVKELGYTVQGTGPYGIGAPKGIDPAVLRKLHDAFKKGLEDTVHLSALQKFHQEVWYQSPADYEKFAREQWEREKRALDRLGLLRKG